MTDLACSRLDEEDAVLLIIDVQTKLMAAMEDRDRVYRNTGILLTAARALQIPVVVTEQYPKGLGPTVPEVAELLPPDVRVLEKTAFDAARDGLLPVLEGLGRRSVLLCGDEAHICVFQTARSLLEAGYRVFAVEDAICSRSSANCHSCPPKRLMPLFTTSSPFSSAVMVKKAGNTLGAADQRSWAPFCKNQLTPMAVISTARDAACRRGL